MYLTAIFFTVINITVKQPFNYRQMAEPTLTQVFGAGATQDSTTLTIDKANLTGLTASANNSAESLFVAILLKAKDYLTQTNLDANADQSVLIDFPSFNAQTLETRNNVQYRKHDVVVSLYKPDAGNTIDPDDY